LSSYLADTRKARVLGADGRYSRPKSVRNGHGFSVQEYLMQVASANEDALSVARNQRSILRKPAVAYTPSDVTAPPSGPQAEPDTQETSNAAV